MVGISHPWLETPPSAPPLCMFLSSPHTPLFYLLEPPLSWVVKKKPLRSFLTCCIIVSFLCLVCVQKQHLRLSEKKTQCSSFKAALKELTTFIYVGNVFARLWFIADVCHKCPAACLVSARFARFSLKCWNFTSRWQCLMLYLICPGEASLRWMTSWDWNTTVNWALCVACMQTYIHTCINKWFWSCAYSIVDGSAPRYCLQISVSRCCKLQLADMILSSN